MSAVHQPQIGSEPYFRQLVEQVGVALIATDLELNIKTWNAAAARMFGAAADRMMGTPVVSVVPQERRPVAERILRRAIESGQTYRLRVSVSGKLQMCCKREKAGAFKWRECPE